MRSSLVAPDIDLISEIERYITYLIKETPVQEELLLLTKIKLLRAGLKVSQIRAITTEDWKEIDIHEIGIRMTLRDNIKIFKRLG